MKKMIVLCLWVGMVAVSYADDDLSIQFDASDMFGAYQDGIDAPAQYEGVLTSSHSKWSLIGTVDPAGPFMVANANAVETTIDLTVDEGRTDDGVLDWGLTLNEWGVASMTPPYHTSLMTDWLNYPEYETMGVRLKGLPGGLYKVYVMAKQTNQVTDIFDVVVGVNIVDSNSLQPGALLKTIGDATGVTGWALDKNYTAVDIALSNPGDWINMFIDCQNFQYGTLNGFQIVDLTPWRPALQSPSNGSSNVDADNLLTLSWQSPTSLSPGSYNVYCGDDADAVASADTGSAGIFQGNTTNTTLDVSVLKDKSYFWRVDAVFETYPVGDPNRIAGSRTWTFDTELSLPVITAQPVSVWANVGDEVTFEAVATDPLLGTLNYAWYRGLPGDTSNPVGTNSPTLTFTLATVDINADFYCSISNANGSINTSAARVGEKMAMAHWAMESDPNNAVAGSPATIVEGIPASVTGVIGNARSFDGDDGLKSDQGGSYFDPLYDNCTVSVWVKTTSMPSWGPIVSKFGEAEGWQLRRYGSSGSAVFSTRGTGNEDAPTSTTNVLDGQWHHVVGTFNSYAGVKRVYVDGLLEGETTIVSSMTSTTAPVGIGSRYKADGSIDKRFSGSLDEVKLFSYPMTASEVADLYLEGGLADYVCTEYPGSDLNGDCKVTLADFAEMASEWLECNRIPESTCTL